MSQWKSMDDAPKDGTPVLLFSPDSHPLQVFMGHYLPDEDGETGEWYDYWRQDGCWPIDTPPTRWMPLPEPPNN